MIKSLTVLVMVLFLIHSMRLWHLRLFQWCLGEDYLEHVWWEECYQTVYHQHYQLVRLQFCEYVHEVLSKSHDKWQIIVADDPQPLWNPNMMLQLIWALWQCNLEDNVNRVVTLYAPSTCKVWTLCVQDVIMLLMCPHTNRLFDILMQRILIPCK